MKGKTCSFWLFYRTRRPGTKPQNLLHTRTLSLWKLYHGSTMLTDPWENAPTTLHISRPSLSRCIVLIIGKTSSEKQLKSIIYNWEKLLIFPDFPAAILKQRTYFNRTNDLLPDRPRVHFRLLKPGKVPGLTQWRGNVLHWPGEGDCLCRAAFWWG